MTRVLVTGATGFIGLPAVALLAERGYEVHAVSSATRPEVGEGGVHWHRFDLLDPQTPGALIARTRPTELLHLAWHTVPGEYWSAAQNRDWRRASRELISEFAKADGQRVVIAGSCAEYEWGHGVCSEGRTPLLPATLYGRCKDALRADSEQIAATAGLSLAWGRVFFVYGPREQPRRLVPEVASALIAGRAAACTEGHQRRDFLFVDDVAAALVEMLASEVEGPVNVGSGEAVAVREVVTRIARASGNPELIRFGALAARADDPEELVADVRRLTEEVGFRPQVDLDEGIARTVAWWRAELQP